MSQLKTLDGKICFRLLAMAQFIVQNGEYGLEGCNYRFLPSAYRFCINAGRNMQKQIRLAYTHRGATGVDALLSEEHISDISLVFDELLDADNIPELLELIKQHKKSNIIITG